MRIQLLHPPVYLNVRSLTALRPSIPLGLAYVAGALREAGNEVSVLDAVAEGVDQVIAEGRLHRLGLDLPQILERIDRDADVIGISNNWSFAWPLVRRLIEEIKRAFPDKILIGGGEHFSGLPELSLNSSPLDYLVIGEGEETVIELMTVLAIGGDPATVDGIAFKNGDEIVKTRPRARCRQVDDLPWPAWDLFRLDVYNRRSLVSGLKNGFTVPILATRGCPYQCTYCSSPSMWTTKWYPRDPVRVVDEIEHYLRHYGASNFPFQDLTAILRRDWIIAFCQEILRRNFDIRWQFPSGTRCEVIDDEVASLLKKSGGRHLAFAPESGSDETRRRIKKQMSREKLLGAVRAAVKNDLSLACFFVLGFPDDEPKDLRATVRLARRLAWMGVSDIAVGYFFPIPNTEIFRELDQQGRLALDDRFLTTPMFANDPWLRAENNYCTNVPAWKLSLLKHWIVANFYALSFATRPWRLARIAWNFAHGVETMKLESFLIELKRKLAIWIGRRKPPVEVATAPRPAARQPLTTRG